MAIYSLASRTSATASSVASLEVRAAAANRPRLMEAGLWVTAATNSVVGLGRPQAIGVTPTSPVNVLAEDPADPTGMTQIALAWGTGPTVPLQFFRRVNIPATIGAGVILTFPRGLVIGAGLSLVHWNISTVAAMDTHHVVDE